MGVANIDSAARTCHAPSTVGLKQTIGVAASTCSMQDVLETDLIVLWGTNVANNQPVFTKYLYLARKRGAPRSSSSTRTSSPGLERYWVPSNVESALFGTKLCDLHVPVRPGGRRRPGQRRAAAPDRARRRRPRRAIAAHTEGWDELAAPRRAASTGPSCWPRPASTTSTFERVRRPLRRRRRGRCWCGAWASPSTPTASTACGRSSTSAWPAATSVATAPA